MIKSWNHTSSISTVQNRKNKSYIWKEQRNIKTWYIRNIFTKTCSCNHCMWETCAVPDLVLRLSPKIKFEITVSLDTKGIIKLTIRKRTDIVMERILKKGMNTNNSKTQNRTVLEATQSKPHKNQGFSRCYGTISSSRITCQYKSGNRSFFSVGPIGKRERDCVHDIIIVVSC